jgi:hypothetical protein
VRYYDLTLTNPNGQIVALSQNGFAPSSTGLPTFSSRIPNPNGNGDINNPAALNLELDMPIAPYAVPQGLQSIRLWGIGLQQIAQSANFNANPATSASAYSFVLQAGMKPGLPLASDAAAYSGIIARGSIYQAFGNWQGVNQTLDFVVQPADLYPDGGIQFSWLPGQALSVAIYVALNLAFPGYTVNVQGIENDLAQSVSSASVAGHYSSLGDFADMISQQSKAAGPANRPYYPGISVVIRDKTLYAYDLQVPGLTKKLNFQDLIGQPTWLNINSISFKTAIRADVQVGDMVQLPTALATPYVGTTAAAAVPGAPIRSDSVFKGAFLVQEVHHYANFRQPDADSWSTAFVAVATGS